MPRQRRQTPHHPFQESEPPMTRHRQSTTTIDPLETAPAVEDQAQVTIISGANLQTFPLAGMTVGHARVLLEPLMVIHPHAPMLVNGRAVNVAHELQSGDTLEFVHHAGEKGGTRWNRD